MLDFGEDRGLSSLCVTGVEGLPGGRGLDRGTLSVKYNHLGLLSHN